MPKQFTRHEEDFTCEHCGVAVKGDGYTNHCPHCLWSKHIDNQPGDRSNNCCGLMEPIGTEESGGKWSVIQKCQKCCKIHKNKLSTMDNFDKIVKISN